VLHTAAALFAMSAHAVPYQQGSRAIGTGDAGERVEKITDITAALSTLISRGDDDQVLDLPGFDPLFFLLRVHQLAHTGDYDRIILDLAPTGETLSLLQFPELLGSVAPDLPDTS